MYVPLINPLHSQNSPLTWVLAVSNLIVDKYIRILFLVIVHPSKSQSHIMDAFLVKCQMISALWNLLIHEYVN